MLWAVSPEGATLFQEVLPVWTPRGLCDGEYPFRYGPGVSSRQIAVGKEGIIVQHSYETFWEVDGGYPSGGSVNTQVGSGLLVAFDGGVISSLPILNFSVGNGANLLAPVSDTAGNSFLPGIVADAGPWGVSAIQSTGPARWTSSALGSGSLALSDDGLLFGFQADQSGQPTALVAIDSHTGGPIWAAEALAPVSAHPQGVALTPGASIITLSGNEAVAFFAGKHRLSSTAPWSRWGGDNSNRNCAR